MDDKGIDTCTPIFEKDLNQVVKVIGICVQEGKYYDGVQCFDESKEEKVTKISNKNSSLLCDSIANLIMQKYPLQCLNLWVAINYKIYASSIFDWVLIWHKLRKCITKHDMQQNKTETQLCIGQAVCFEAAYFTQTKKTQYQDWMNFVNLVHLNAIRVIRLTHYKRQSRMR